MTLPALIRRWSSPGWLGATLLALVLVPVVVMLPVSVQKRHYNNIRLQEGVPRQPPGWVTVPAPAEAKAGAPAAPTRVLEPMGTDKQGRSLLHRCLLGGAISLAVGLAAAAVAVAIGVTYGALAGYLGGRADMLMMRLVDILYGLPYLLIMVMIKVAVDGLTDRMGAVVANAGDDPGPWIRLCAFVQDHPLPVNLATLVLAIGCVSWLTMARVIRGQVLSLRSQPFIEAARAVGAGPGRIFFRHLLPNCTGPIIVYATLAVPAAILEESFLSFLGLGVQDPLPSWGALAADGVGQLVAIGQPDLSACWWLPLFPCALLGLTLLALHFIGDGLRERFDPRSAARKA